MNREVSKKEAARGATRGSEGQMQEGSSRRIPSTSSSKSDYTGDKSDGKTT